MKVLSLFNGISCGMLALDRANIPVERYVSYEIDEYANTITKKNYPQIECHKDVRSADFSLYKGFDLVIGGFPCQDLSIAGKRKGLKGERSGLFWEFVRAIKEVNPKYFLVENNYGMPERDKQTITDALGVEPILINSNLVSAQNRKRLYWTNIPNVEQPDDKGIVISDILEEGASSRESYDMPRAVECKNYVQYDNSGKGNKSQTWRAHYTSGKYGAVCAHAPGKHKVTFDKKRYIKLSLNEVEKLQTLPTGYTHLDSKIFSLSKSLCAIGNGWTVDVIAHIFSFINKGE